MNGLTLFIIAFLLGPGITLAQGVQEPSIVDIWQYDGFFYDNHRYPRPDPALVLTFTFRADGTNRLHWYRTNESGFCEREAAYEIRGQNLWQKVTWLNPANARDCGQDPDMRMGRETLSRFALKSDQLDLFFDLNGKEFIYILRRCGPSGAPCLEQGR